ncbi:hypothetical protein ACVWW4_007939 [Bradyrhizobium sp. LB7.1]
MTSRANIACLGAGRMGRGIAVAFAYAGHTVTMIDIKARSTEDFARLEADALGEVRKTFASLSKLGLVTEADVDPLIARISVVPASQSGVALSDAGIVFEGVPEVVELKREILGAASKQIGAGYDHRLNDVDHSRRRSLRCHREPPTLPQRALAQSSLSDTAGRGFARQGYRSCHHRRGQGAARRHRQGAGGLRGDARLHRSAHPGARDERGRAHGRGRRRQRRRDRQGDPLRLRLPLRRARAARIHRLGRRRHFVLRQPLSRRRTWQ